MNLALITLEQVSMLFILILTGFVCGKTGVVTEDGKKVLSNLLVMIIMPAMVLNSYLSEFNPEVLSNLLLAFGLSTIAILIAMAVSFLLTLKMKSQNRTVIRFACSFSNAAYMGFPLIQALFGAEGMIYASAFVTMFNVIVWSVGYAMMSGEVKLREVLKSVGKNPVTYAVLLGLLLYLGRVPVPSVIQEPVRLVGSMTTPLSMMIIGIMIAGSRITSVLGNREVWFTVVTRLVLIPAVTFGLFYLLGVGGIVGSVILIQAACPTAATTSVLAIQFHHDETVGAGTVVLSTICSIVTLTVFAMLIQVL
ncbi:MAG: AEC family transporter [Lachnospiraceae bacterium]|nr:AEC family transporter [Lachnospiraceae bacterium]MBP3609217.1 AEC family transporter [Lachnospiraceae bacterium]